MLGISNQTKLEPPTGGLIVKKIKQEILGKSYDLSLVYAGNRLSKSLNLKYRQKNCIPNILSFPLSPKSGEVVLNISQSGKEAQKYKISRRSYFIFLLIHSMLHLKGFRHSQKMTRKERFFLKKFKIHITDNLRNLL